MPLKQHPDAPERRAVPKRLGPRVEIDRVRDARLARARAQQEWEDAICAAHAAEFPLRQIGGAAGVSHVRVLQIVRGH